MQWSYLPSKGKEPLLQTQNSLDEPISTASFGRRRSPKSRPSKRVVCGILGVACLTALLIYTVCSARQSSQLLQSQLAAPPRIPQTYYTATQDAAKPAYGCGNSSAEAQAEGCIFDTMSFAWVRPPCYDANLTAEFFVTNPWVRYYQDDNGTVEADPEKLRLGMYPELMITWRYHLTHCMWMWTKMHRAMMGNRPLDSYAASMDHTHHCTDQVMLDADWMNGLTKLDEINTPIMTKYTTCPEA